MKTPEQQSELSKLRDVYQDARSTLIEEGWVRLSKSIDDFVEALEAKAISAAELVEKAREWCKAETTHVTYEGEYQMKNSEKSAAWLLAVLEAEVGK